ncbi:MAG TPA: hypothetical protein VFM46_12565 [Pseudomonadales bacterium]|nr:hypothetical protein [Pseudomonadales bacterium]
MSITRAGHRYIDVESGKTVDTWFPLTKPGSKRSLSGKSPLLFRHNSQTGAVEAIPTNSSRWGGLINTLHLND